MTNDLVGPDDLAHLPGAPFTDAEVDSAAAALRKAAGWHIAPVRSETVALDIVPAEPVLRLPTRQLVSVTAVRRTSDATVYATTQYETSKRLARIRRRSSYWPCGYEAVEVDMTHGYTTCPPDLLPVIAQCAVLARRDTTVRTVAVDDASTTYTSSGVTAYLDRCDALAQYLVDRIPGVA